tara:strand:+ start:1554 stop:2405 length:852 start_codon:yes stop_codon:yes gene_type:complete
MAVVTWTGTTNGDWNTTTNWSTGALPGAGDDVIFNTSSRDVTISSSVAGTTYGSLKILDGFTGSLGVSGTKLEVMATSLLIATDAAKIHLDGHHTTAIITDIHPGTAASPNVTFGTSSQITTLRITGGAGAVEVASAGITTTQMLDAPRAVLSILSTASSVTNILMDSGTITTAESITTADVSGGSLELTGAAGATTVNLTGSGTLRHNSTGTVATLNVFDRACLATTAGNSTSTGPVFTTTNLYDGQIDERNGAATTTFSNGIVVNGAGTIRPDVSRTLTVT